MNCETQGCKNLATMLITERVQTGEMTYRLCQHCANQQPRDNDATDFVVVEIRNATSVTNGLGTDVTEMTCDACSYVNRFGQPHLYHAGFANQGFLYNDAGDITLVWSTFDSAYKAIVGDVHPWELPAELESRFEELLSPAPSGGRFRFTNPARCLTCGAPIHEPIAKQIHFLLYPNSLDVSDSLGGLSKYLTVAS